MMLHILEEKLKKKGKDTGEGEGELLEISNILMNSS